MDAAIERLKGDVDEESWIKPLLLLVEYSLTDRSNPNFIAQDRSLHLEHILPRKYSSFKEWAHFSVAAEKYLHTIGNMTLLSGKKNVEASNNPFVVKIPIYKGMGKHDKKMEGASAFLVTQKLLEQVVGSREPEWTEALLTERRDWLYARIENILNIELLPKKLRNTA